MSSGMVVSADYDKRSSESLAQCATSLLAILTTFFGIILARVSTHHLGASPIRSYLLEFGLITVPGVLFVTVASDYAALFVALIILLLGLFIYSTRSLKRARRREFDLGKRPTMLTVVRALTHLITAICILAIDFESFHRPFRKSRQYGAHLMDTGIGLFVVTMGLVSRRPRNLNDIRRSLLWSVLPLLLLGFARTIVILFIDYHQDVHEYGEHMNAFFTLGLTKLLGTAFSVLARNNGHLLPMALVILVAHQFALSRGVADYVLDEDMSRSTWLSANREGLLSLPGFVVIYLISIYFSRWLVSKSQLSYAQMKRKLTRLLWISLGCWGLVISSAYIFGISRVLCNFGYVAWMFAITATMLWLTMFICDFIINTVMPIPVASCVEEGILSAGPVGSSCKFLICEALNMNGLTFFMLANVLTGGVNIFLKPENRSDSSSVVILIGYMFVAVSVVFVLYKKRIRIA